MSVPFVTERFVINEDTKDIIRCMTPKFGYDGFGELTFYRTYSRIQCPHCRVPLKYHKVIELDLCPICGRDDQGQENWADVVLRNTTGTFSIRKDWYIKNHIHWDEEYWQAFARRFAIAMFKMWWLPPGRGLWAMGTDFVYDRGSMALSNCAFSLLGEEFNKDIAWVMDALMHGVGVGFSPVRDDDLTLYEPKGSYDFVIPDTREGWTDSADALILSYRYGWKKPRFIYDKLRPYGALIRGFGGIASGPGPLKWYHEKIDEFCHYYLGDMPGYDSVNLKADLSNGAGCCTVAGNVRRSAELGAGKITDQTFIDLKNYDRFPYREDIGWMSNNSVYLEKDSDFEMLGEIAQRVIKNGEPGYINLRNLPFGRIGKRMRGLRKDRAIGFNPCGEQPLEDKEVCIIAETCPTVCENPDQWYEACRFANFYAQTVALLPTHQSATNRVIARNRRIGISIIDFTGWKHAIGMNQVIKHMRKGYKIIRKHNRKLAEEAGVPESIRVTNIKPGGTVPKLPGKTSGIGHPTFKYTSRRIRVQQNVPFNALLREAGIPVEPDHYSMNTDCFSYPIIQGPAVPASEVSLWEQAMNLVTVQREWADNAVSNTLYFRPKWPIVKEILGYGNGQMNLVETIIGDLESFAKIQKWIESADHKDELFVDNFKIVLFKNKEHEISKIKIHRYDPRHEEDHIEAVLSHIAPHTKSVALCPHTPKGAYIQMPEEGITEEEYHELKAAIKPINWSRLSGSDGIDEKYCSGPSCEIPVERS